MKKTSQPKLLSFTVTVNPFTQTAIVKLKRNKCTHEVELNYKDIDEWQGITIDGQSFDVHFCYDKKLTVSIYDVIEQVAQTQYWHKVKLIIKLKD